MYPNTKVIGTDLSPIQPTWVPENVEFRIDDLEKEWIFEDNTFDLVHDRLCSGLAIKNWPSYLAEAFRTTKPGGWTESQEFDLVAKCDDGTVPEDGAIVKWHTLFAQAALTAGINMRVNVAELEQHYKDAGFINVQSVEFKLPMGIWSRDPVLREVGALAWGGLMEGISGLSLALFTKVFGWTQGELEAFLNTVKIEWNGRTVHPYWPL